VLKNRPIKLVVGFTELGVYSTYITILYTLKAGGMRALFTESGLLQVDMDMAELYNKMFVTSTLCELLQVKLYMPELSCTER
jgi:hypothetical protein